MKNWLFIFFLTITNFAFPWWDGGHLFVAQVAYNELRPEVKEKVDHLSALFKPYYPKLSTFVSSSIWADIVKENGFSLFDKYHYIDLPFDPDHILKNHTPASENVVTFIETAIKTLKNTRTAPFEKALILRLLIHCVADIHQPLHCCTLYNKKHRKGDLGGNFYKIKGKYPNLHSLWDSGAGVFSEERYLESPFSALKQVLATTQKYPRSSFPGLKTPSPNAWAKESYELAKTHAYTLSEGANPSKEYLSNTQEICEKRAMLAGYRLANLLNSIPL